MRIRVPGIALAVLLLGVTTAAFAQAPTISGTAQLKLHVDSHPNSDGDLVLVHVAAEMSQVTTIDPDPKIGKEFAQVELYDVILVYDPTMLEFQGTFGSSEPGFATAPTGWVTLRADGLAEVELNARRDHAFAGPDHRADLATALFVAIAPGQTEITAPTTEFRSTKKLAFGWSVDPDDPDPLRFYLPFVCEGDAVPVTIGRDRR
jgi:hypothetical protein